MSAAGCRTYSLSRLSMWFVLGLTALLVVACGNGSGAESEPQATRTPILMPGDNGSAEIHIPQQAPVEGEQETMDAELVGRLVLDGGCLYIDEEHSGTRFLPNWPPGYTYSISEGQLQIHDETGRVIVSEGDQVRISGGGVPSLPVPEKCSGSFWLTGDSIERLSSEPYGVHFPRLVSAGDLRETMNGQLVGELVLEGGCLYVDEEEHGTRFLPLWSLGYMLADVEGRIVILDGSSMQTVVNVGNRVVVRGAEVPDSDLEGIGIELLEPLPEECAGRLWLGGMVGWLPEPRD